MRRWMQPGLPPRRQEALAEGCELYSLVQRLCVLEPAMRDELLPAANNSGGSALLEYEPPSAATAASDAASGGGVRAGLLEAAFRFFEERVGRVEVAVPRDKSGRGVEVVHFGFPGQK